MHFLTTYIVKTPWLISVAWVLDLPLDIYPFSRAVFQNMLKCNIFSLNARPVTFLLKLQIISFMSVLL